MNKLGGAIAVSAWLFVEVPSMMAAEPLVPSAAPEIPDLEIYDSHLSPVAGDGTADGVVRYGTFRADTDRLDYPLDSCLVQHGYVVDQSLLQRVASEGAEDNPHFKHFIRTYYGFNLIVTLTTSVCRNVIVAMHEAILSDGVEFTKRTERFLRDVVCEQGSCAVFGHSKGGAAATNIARRCMHETSELGESGCRKLKEIYSASGSNTGAGFGALVYGVYRKNPQSPMLRFMQRKAFDIGIRINFTDPASMDYRPGRSNPIWVDISPIAPMEGGVPVAIINDIQLHKRGWLVADYAASASGWYYRPGRLKVYGCGERSASDETTQTCIKAGNILGKLHSGPQRRSFERGINAWLDDDRFIGASGTTEYLNDITWPNYQISDGLVEFERALTPCTNGGSAVMGCKAFETLNHHATAGASPQAVLDVVQQFSHFGG